MLGTIVNAQDNTTDNRNALQIGVKVGGSYSNVYDTQGQDFNADAKLGFTGGAFLAIPIGTYLGVQPEVLVTQKGFKATGDLLGFPYTFTRTSTFLDIPIFLALKPSPFLTLLVGPQYSYLMKQKDVFTSSAVSYQQQQQFELNNVRKNIFGIAAGLDINIGIVVLSGRVGWDVQDNNGDGTSSSPRYKNVSGQIDIGFRL
ncbi:MAG: porin family protein [Bacteroidia bacterium]